MRFFIVIILIAFPLLNGAQNLVPNHSFEEYTDCPGYPGQFELTGWQTWSGSADYFNACSSSLSFLDSLVDVPFNGFGYQYPSDGEAYAGIATMGVDGGTPDYREIIGVELTEPLQIGEVYSVSFKASLGFKGYAWMIWATNQLGLLFTNQTYDWLDNPVPLSNFAHVNHNEFITDTLNWTEISGYYTAEEAYTHIGIGNFFNDNMTDTIHLLEGASLGAYYYIDEVIVSRSTSVSEISNISEVNIYPNPISEHLNIKLEENIQSIQILDMKGRIVWAQGAVHQREMTIHVNALSQGVYLLRIDDELGNGYFEKLIKE